MATINKAKIKKTVLADGYVLELSEIEATTLMTLSGAVTGTQKSMRRITDSLYATFREMGVERYQSKVLESIRFEDDIELLQKYDNEYK